MRLGLDVLGPRQRKDFLELGRQLLDGREHVVQLLLLAGAVQPVVRLGHGGVRLHEVPVVARREPVRVHVVQPREADEAQVRSDQHVPAVAEGELALEGFAGKVQLADHGGEWDDVKELGRGAVQELLADLGVSGQL